MTYTEISKKMGVTSQCVTQWFTGKRQPNLQTLKELKKILNCSYDDLINRLLSKQEDKGETTCQTTSTD